MAISTAAKAGIGGSLGTVAVGGPAATYLAWDHITLHEVEREVLEKDFKLTVSHDSSNKKVKIEAPKSTEADKDPRLKKDYSWSCEITKTEGTSDEVDNTIKETLENHLLRTNLFSESQRIAKRLLVKACSKSRDESTPSTDKKVVGTLKVKKEKDQFVFVNQPQLNYLLKPTLYEVEEKVSNLNVQLKKGEDSKTGNLTVVTVNTVNPAANGFVVLDEGYSWSCKITIDPKTTGQSVQPDTLWNKIRDNLPTSDGTGTDTNKKLENKAKLVKACSKNRETTNLSYKSVVGKLTVKETEVSGSKFSFEKNPELNSLFGS